MAVFAHIPSPHPEIPWVRARRDVVNRRSTLKQLRAQLLFVELDDEWRTPSELADALGVGHGHGWVRVALVLERLANDDRIEIKGRGRVRRFRRKA